MYTNKMLKGLGICFLAALALIVVACTSPSSSSSSPSTGTTDTTGGGTPGGGATVIDYSKYPSMTFDETASPKYGLNPFEGTTSTVTTVAAEGITADTGDNAASGNIIKIVNLATGQPWAGANIFSDGKATGLSSFFKFSSSATAKKTVIARVYVSAVGIPVTLRLEAIVGRGAQTIDSTVLTTVVGWQTVTFDFNAANLGNPGGDLLTSSPEGGWNFAGYWATFSPVPTTSMSNPAPTTAADSADIYFDYQQPKSAEKVYYIDNIRFLGDADAPVTPVTPVGAAQTISFDETASPQYTLIAAAGSTVTQVTTGASVDTGTNAAAGNYYKIVNPTTADVVASAIIQKDTSATGLGSIFAFGTTGNKIISARVNAPAADIPVTFHITSTGATPKVLEATVLTTTSGWQNLTWNFESQMTGNPSADHLTILSTKTYQNGSAEGGWAFKEWWTKLNATPPTTTNISNPKPTVPAARAAMFFDYQQPKSAEKIFYVDNVRFGDVAATPVMDFEAASSASYGLSGFEGATHSIITTDTGLPVDSGTNAATGNIYKVVNGASGQPWAGVNLTNKDSNTDAGIATFFAFSTSGNYKVSARVYVPAVGIPVTFQVNSALTDAGNNPCEATVLSTVAGWQTLVWDFSLQLTGNPSGEFISTLSSKTYQNGSVNGGWAFKEWLTHLGATINLSGDASVATAPADQAQIFFDYQQPKTAAEKTFYIDNIRFGAAP